MSRKTSEDALLPLNNWWTLPIVSVFPLLSRHRGALENNVTFSEYLYA